MEHPHRQRRFAVRDAALPTAATRLPRVIRMLTVPLMLAPALIVIARIL